MRGVSVRGTRRVISIILDIYDSKANFLGVKAFKALEGVASINEWVRAYRESKEPILGYLNTDAPDFQNYNKVWIGNETGKGHIIIITPQNLLPLSVYFSVRHCIKPTWINDRDQFYAPYDDSWQSDSDFLGDCLVFMLFHSQNRISCALGANHFIPFKEGEVNPKARYTHHTLLEFLAGKSVAFAPTRGLFKDNAPQGLPCSTFSPSAQVVLQAGKKLYAYYHAQEGSKPNASFYDIKEFFAGRNAKGKLNPPSKATDAHYKELYSALQESLINLATQIAPKVRRLT
ncbi:nucleoside 5-triphosphatase RdgB (dHAPTP, dITP,XTP-specific) [Helicobacter labacensis]|uniref:nucleoside 5-triphosphatase RdgB (dHAPTP, dITP,XTP-specific) n=1 Tax=Helicobacter labacensis TaxID=2316079 RepID=UPI000EB147EF|nr:nucleoside 5-triphosphatase RdgB (dHAPTP, dITP,XTP-specific) [Helicobacter labacensis]